jgi:stearoyl-CoA desaturase (Delta-9 desaturase)
MDKALTRRPTTLAAGFVLLHAAAALALVAPPTPGLLALAAASYLVRMFGVTAGYHRYFSHRSYKTGRAFQFVLAWLAQSSAQKGVLWWAAHHRDHHRHADGEADVHSPRHGFWWSHAGWVLSSRFDSYEPRRVADFGGYAELRWLDRHHWVPAVSLAAGLGAAGGLPALVWGFVLPTLGLYHATFAINSVAHVWGTRPFETRDDSRNNFLLAVLTLGEGWHNNHHYCMSSARQGVRWWQIDPTFLGLRVLSACGLVRDLRPFVDHQRRRGGGRAAA